MSDTLLYFETRAFERPNFALYDTIFKIMGGVGEISQSVFTAIKNTGKISDFLTPCKIGGEMTE